MQAQQHQQPGMVMGYSADVASETGVMQPI
jgi:hypothetical protein